MERGDSDNSDSRDRNVVYIARQIDGQGWGVPYRVELLRRKMERCLVSVLRTALGRAQEMYAQASEGQEREGVEQDSIRQAELSLRLHRHDMEEVLRAGLEFRFQALIDPLLAQPPTILPESPLEQEFIDRLCNRVAQEADKCTALLDRLLVQRAVSPHNSPLTPEHVADLFMRAEQMAQIDIEQRGLTLNVFGEELECSLLDFYRSAVELLAGRVIEASAQGALPDSGELERAESQGEDPVTRAARSRKQVETGRQQVGREIERCLAGREVPAMVDSLLRETWARLLLLIYVSEGPDSEEWVRNCAIMERLVWSFQAPVDEISRQRLVLEIPMLLHELADGLHLVLQDPFELTRIVRGLEAEYLASLTADDPELERLSANDEPIGSRLRGDSCTSLESLPAGTWMEIEHEDGEPLRVRLAGSDDDGMLIFTNRAGFKVLEREPASLAAAVIRGDAKLLADDQLLNAGLSRVMRRLSDRRLGHGQ